LVLFAIAAFGITQGGVRHQVGVEDLAEEEGM